MGSRAACAALLLVVSARIAAAQDTLTLERCIGEALAHNPGLTAARAGAEEAGARRDEARAAYFPRVSFTESWQRGDQPVFVFGALLSARRFAAGNFAIDALNEPGPMNLFHGIFAIEQILFDGGRTRAAVRATSGGLSMARAAEDEARAALVARVTETYGHLLAATSARRAALSAVEAAREDLARAEHKRDAGVLGEAEVLSLAVHLAEMQQRAVVASGEIATAAAELNRLAGAPITREVTSAEPPPPATSRPAADLPSLFAAAERSRPELRRAAATVETADALAAQSRAALRPQVVARGAYQVDGTRFSERASAWVFGGELQWSWSAGGGPLAAARAAAQATARARAELDDLRAAVQVEVLGALRRLEAAEAAEALARAAVTQARESDRITRNRYDAGLAGVADVLRAATASLDAEARRIGAIAGRLNAAAALTRATGGESDRAR